MKLFLRWIILLSLVPGLKKDVYFEISFPFQAYGGCQTGEAVDPILWAKMEQIEGVDCLSQSSGCHKTNLPLLLVLGYASGIQVRDDKYQLK